MNQKFDDAYFKQHLTEQEYHVLRENGTELPFSGEYVNCKKDGSYHCKGCNSLLFSSKDKYDSGSGWPSFTKPESSANIEYIKDSSHGLDRIEVRCGNCKCHLGHVFDDGPTLTAKRYCINSCSLKLKRK